MGTSEEVNYFLKYLKKQIDKHNGWYEAFKGDDGCPSTSNGIESNNRSIEYDHTFRERWPMGRFMGKALEIVESWSFDRNYDENPNFKVLNLVPVISLKHWKSAYEFVETNGTFLQFDHQETPEKFILKQAHHKELILCALKRDYGVLETCEHSLASYERERCGIITRSLFII